MENNDTQEIETAHMIATCGHVDILGYFMHTVCGKCADKGYESVTGRKAKRIGFGR